MPFSSLPCPPRFTRLLRSAVLGLALVLAGCSTTVTRMPASSGFSDLVPEAEIEPATDEDPATLIARGEDLLGKGQGGLAVGCFVRALRLAPDDLRAGCGLGHALFRDGRPQQARAVFARILETNPDHLPALAGGAQAARRAGDTDGALAWLTRARALAPNDPRLLDQLAAIHQDRGEPERAAPLYRELVALLPGDAAACNNLGYNQLLLGRYPEAVATLSRALALAPGNRRIRNNLAVAWALGGRDEVALDLFRDVVGEAAAWNNLGFLNGVRGDWRQAMADLRRAVDLNPVYYPRAMNNLEQVERLAAQAAY